MPSGSCRPPRAHSYGKCAFAKTDTAHVTVGGSKCVVVGAGGKEGKQGIKEGRVLNVDGGKQVYISFL